VGVLLVGALILALHVTEGGAYRTATIGALTFRTLLTGAFHLLARRVLRNTVQPSERTHA